jgi:hypothetical protein
MDFNSFFVSFFRFFILFILIWRLLYSAFRLPQYIRYLL